MSDFRAYFPRFLAIYRPYFPRPGLPKTLSRLFPPAFWASNGIRRDFRAYFPWPARTFAPISPGLLRPLCRLSRLFPRPTVRCADLSRLFTLVRLVFKSRQKTTFALISPDLTARLIDLLVSSDNLIDQFL